MSDERGGWTPAEPPSFGGGDPQWQQPSGAPKPGIIALRPLSFTEILEATVRLLRRHAGTVFGIAAALAAIQAVATSALVLAMSGSISDAAKVLNWQPGSSTPESMTALFADLRQVVVALGVAAIVSFMVSLIGTGLFTVLTARAVLGKPLTFAQAWEQVRARLGALLGTTLVYLAGFVVFVAAVAGIAIALGQSESTVGFAILVVTVAIIGAFWAAFRLLLVNTIVVLEKCGPRMAFARSWKLTKGSWWRIFGIVAVATLIATTIGSLVSVPVVSLGTASGITSDGLTDGAVVAANFLSTFVQGLLSVPFVSAVISLLYVDLRMRKENLAPALIQASEETE